MSSSNNSAKHAQYSPGHDPAVLRTHSWRNVENSAPYLKGLLEPHMKILDVGCGPGSITVDLAAYVPQGHVTGVENIEAPLEAARVYAAERGVKNVDFLVGDALALPFPDNTFDVTHAHQVLQHTGDPIQMLREMRRVTKPGGLVACRESDSETMVWAPENKALREWRLLTARVARAEGREPDSGRLLHIWARQAGFDPAKITTSVGTWCFRTKEEREYWGGTMGSRVLNSGFGRAAVARGFATQEELERLTQAWKDWVADDDGFFAMLHGQIVCMV